MMRSFVGLGSVTGAAALMAVLAAPAGAAEPNGSAGEPLQARALVEARHQAVLSSEIAGRIARLSIEPGMAFKAGEVLVGFECASYQAEFDVARAELRAAEVTARVNRHLQQLKSIGEADVELAAAKAEVARANLRKAEVQVKRCEVKAPFDGRVVSRNIREHESVPPGQALLEILSHRDLKVTLIVPSSWQVWLKPGQPFDLTVDETGARYRGEVTLLGAKVDPTSQSLTVTGKLGTTDQAGAGLIPGMSGTASFPADANQERVAQGRGGPATNVR